MVRRKIDGGKELSAQSIANNELTSAKQMALSALDLQERQGVDGLVGVAMFLRRGFETARQEQHAPGEKRYRSTNDRHRFDARFEAQGDAARLCLDHHARSECALVRQHDHIF